MPVWHGGGAIDIGCGPVGALPALSELVGADGRVAGLDSRSEALALARSILNERGVTVVALIQGECDSVTIRALGPPGPSDVAYVRRFLVHQPDPAASLRRVVVFMRPEDVSSLMRSRLALAIRPSSELTSLFMPASEHAVGALTWHLLCASSFVPLCRISSSSIAARSGPRAESSPLRIRLGDSVAHFEFRSPLQSIRMAARLAAADEGGGGERRWVGIMDRSLDRLLKLTNELLDVSRLSTGAARLSVSPTDLAEIAGTTATEMQPLLEGKGLVLTRDFPASIPLVSCDGWRIEQVLTNLLDNAIRFTEPGGRITVRARADGDNVVLTVEDTGRGIAADQLPHIFDRYRQAHHGRDGTGLGLALVKAVEESRKGRAASERALGAAPA